MAPPLCTSHWRIPYCFSSRWWYYDRTPSFPAKTNSIQILKCSNWKWWKNISYRPTAHSRHTAFKERILELLQIDQRQIELRDLTVDLRLTFRIRNPFHSFQINIIRIDFTIGQCNVHYHPIFWAPNFMHIWNDESKMKWILISAEIKKICQICLYSDGQTCMQSTSKMSPFKFNTIFYAEKIK